MTTIHIKEFLNQFSVEELTSKGILRGDTLLLNNRSLAPLMSLMSTHEIGRLQAPERDWYLTSLGEFQNRLSTESKSGNVESLDNPGNVFNMQNASINPFFGAGSDPKSDTDDSSNEARFSLERDLQMALRSNIQDLETGLSIIDGGIERTVDVGRIDITAEDTEGRLVIIELKAGKASLPHIGQLLSYMGCENSDSNRTVRGILVANDFDSRLVAAAKAVPNVSLVTYSFHFSFHRV